jgi:hypothetical protein
MTPIRKTTTRTRPRNGSSSALPIIFGCAGIAIAIALLSQSTPVHCSSDSTSCSSPLPSNAKIKKIYVVYGNIDNKTLKLSRDFNFVMSQVANSNSRIDLDVMKNDTVENLHGDAANQDNLNQLDQLLSVTPSTEIAFTQALSRVAELVKYSNIPIRVAIIHPGTQDLEALKKIEVTANQIALLKPTQLKIWLIGLKPKNKLPTSKALHALRNSIEGSCIDEIQQCEKIIHKVFD